MSEPPHSISEDQAMDLLEQEPNQQLVKRYAYQCVFAPTTGCDGEVTQKGLNPSTVVVTADWKNDHPDRDTHWQQWWCHIECFIKVTGRTMDDLAMREEMRPE